MNPYILVVLNIVLVASSQVLLKIGANSIGPIEFSIGNIFSVIGKIVKSWPIMAGLALLGVGFVVWIMALSKLKLGIAYPMLSATFVIVSIFSAVILRESFSVHQVAGIILIALGMVALFQ